LKERKTLRLIFPGTVHQVKDLLSAEESPVNFTLDLPCRSKKKIHLLHKSFSISGELMSDDTIATASSDRLLHHCHVISLKGDSFRMKDRIKVGVAGFK
jgi:protein tyrosine/serine phosphatase